MKFLPSLTGTLSGSMGGCTASHNRAGQYFRNRVVPTNPNTTRQQNVRSYFTSAVNAWQALTAAQRSVWEVWAANVPMTDVLGQAFYLTGQQAFIRANVPRFQLGFPAVNGPTTFNNGQPVAAVENTGTSVPASIGVIALTSALSITVNLMAAAPVDGDVLFYLGPPVGPGVNFYKGSYRFCCATAIAAAATTVDFTQLIAAQQNGVPLVDGERRPVRFRIAYDDGRLSDPYEIIAPVIDDT